MSVYDPYYGRYSMYRAPSTRSYYSYAAPSPYSAYSGYNGYSTAYASPSAAGTVSQRIYFSFNGKLIRSYKIRRYRRAQKHVLKLFPDLLQGIASSRIQFYVTRPGYSGHGYTGFKSYISKHMWASEVDGLAEHETVGIEVRPSISFTESLCSCFNRSLFN